MINFDYIHRTGLSETVILEKAKAEFDYMEYRFGEGYTTLQQCVDSVIDAEIEYAQG